MSDRIATEDYVDAAAGAPDDATYLVTTANGDLSAEVVVGATPGGELGGTWASPTVDASHSGSTHAAVQAAAEATAASALSAHLTDTSDAHDASTISVVSTTLSGTGTDVQAVFEEIDNLLDDHSGRHENGGADAIKLDDLATPDDNTDLNASTSRHGLLRKLSNTATEYLDGTGAWSTPAGGGGSSETVERDITQTAHGLSVGNAVRMSGANYVKAQADSVANAEVVGIVSVVADANNFTVVTAGRVTGLSGLTAGTVYFLDDDTAGLLTATEPPDAGDVSKPLLVADSTTSGFFVNYRGLIAGDSVAPANAPYYVTTANGGLSAEVVVPAFIQTVLDDTTAVDARATLGVIASLFQSGGAQALALDTLAAPTDITTLNASTSAHGLLKKLPNDASHLLDGLGNWKQIGWIVVTKSGDETVTSNTTLQNDDHLLFTTVAGGVYEFEAAIIYTSASATPDIKFAMGDSGTTQGVGLGGPSFTTADAVQAPGFLVRQTTGAFSAGTGAGGNRLVQINGMFVAIGTSWVLQWAQNTSDGNGVTVKAGSLLRYRRLL